MVKFTKNQVVKIPCEVHAGAFPGEYLIKVSTGKEIVSGFIKENLVADVSGNRGHILARVVEINRDLITVELPGSFFTTTGRTSVSSGWAQDNLQPATA